MDIVKWGRVMTCQLQHFRGHGQTIRYLGSEHSWWSISLNILINSWVINMWHMYRVWHVVTLKVEH